MVQRDRTDQTHDTGQVGNSNICTESYYFNSQVVPFDVHFHYFDNAFIFIA